MVGPPPGALHAILVTYRRPEWLERTADHILEQTLRPSSLFVVDNDPTPEAVDVVERCAQAGLAATYLPAPENLGPAGGIALAMDRLFAIAAPDDWVVLLDDDDPPWPATALADVWTFAGSCVRADPCCGGVGTGGGRFDWARGRIVRLQDAELLDAVPVDFIPGGRLPTYRIGAAREVGGFCSALFFGLEELEFGLRLRRRGYGLYADGNALRRGRQREGRLGLPSTPGALQVLAAQPPGRNWRHYYSLRNLVYLLRRSGRPWVAARVSLERGVLRPLVGVARNPRAGVPAGLVSVRAVRDGWLERMGRTLEPGAPQRRG